MLNVAVVGCGYWGPNLVRNFYQLSDCRVLKVCDMDEGRLSHMRQLYPGVETTRSFEEVVADDRVDAVAIATPVRYHYAMAIEALRNDKHVFIEKPMAKSSAECCELIETAEGKGLGLMVGHTFLYSAVVQRIKSIVDSGDLGEVLYISARRLNLGLFQKDINVTWDLAPHDISIVLHILEERPLGVNCQGKSHVHPEVEDVTNMSLSFRNGLFATVQSSWLDPNKVREMTIVGSRRMLVYNDLEPMEKIKIYDQRVETPPHYDTFAEFHFSYHYGDTYSPYLKQTEPLRVECQCFLDSILTGRKTLSSGYEGLEVIRVLEAASQSLANGGNLVSLPPVGIWSSTGRAAPATVSA